MAWMAIPAAIGLGSALYNAFSDKGEVKQQAKPYDPNLGNFGLPQGGYAANLAAGYTSQSGQALTAAPIQANENQVNMQRLANQQARADQEYANQLLGAAATGQVPSKAEWQMRQGLDQSLANQRAMAASTRGGATAMVAAQRQAAMQAGMANQAIVAQQAALRAGEMERAREAYAQSITGMRGQDIGMLGQESQLALGQGQLALGSRQESNRAGLAWEALAAQTREQERQARMQYEAMKAGQHSSAQAQNMAIAQYNAQLEQQKMMGVTGALMGGATAGLGMMGGGGESVANAATGTGSALGAGSGAAASGAGMTSGRPWP
jgi:hypothetical protein